MRMDFSNFTALIAAAGLVAGMALCWLLMRGRSAVPHEQPTRADTQAELTQARGRIRQLEEECRAAVKNHDDLKHQSARARDLPDLRPKDTAPPPELTAQLTSLQTQLSALQAQEIAARADAAKARSEALAEQAQAREYFRSLEKDQQLAAANARALQVEADMLRGALDQARKEQAQATRMAMLQDAQSHAESAESLMRVQARVAALEQENALLRRTAAALPAPAQALAQASRAQPATAPAQAATQLPVLEAQVMALQDLEKVIKKEFQLLAELQRNVTLTSATRHEFNDSPESRTGNAAAA